MTAPDEDKLLDGKYRLESRLGEGAFGVVYRAYDQALTRPVAVKELRRDRPGMTPERFAEYVDRFRREAQVQAQFNHPHIVHVYDLVNEGATLYLVMELVEGCSLQEALAARGPLPVDRAVRITLELLDALSEVHDHSLDIVHRDLKPSNVLLDRDGRAKLTDFGLAQVGGESSRSRLGGGAHPGSPLYMSPEQAATNDYLRATSDLYSLGCVLFEMLTGTAYKRLDAAPAVLRELRPEVAPSLVAVLERALQEERRARYRRAGDFAAALRAVQAEEAAAAAAAEEAARRQREREAEAQRRREAEEAAAAVEAARRQREADERERQRAAAEAGRLQREKEAEERRQRETAAQERRREEEAAAAARRTAEAAERGGLAAEGGQRSLGALGVLLPILGVVVLCGLGIVLLAWAQRTRQATPAVAVPTATATAAVTQEPAVAPRPRSIDGMVEVWVPGGSFAMGSETGSDGEQPVRTVTLDGYWLDRTEVSNAQYEKCVGAGECRATRYAGDSTYNGAAYPVVGVTWDDAVAYCAWAGGRLPTEAEWEYAARGPEGREYPWGDEFREGHANCQTSSCRDGYEYTAPVGSFPEGASWVGALDMAGNVWEWVGDWYGSYPNSTERNPTGPPTGRYRVVRGGSFINPRTVVRAAYRAVTNSVVHLYRAQGFRCARPQSP